MSSLNMGFELSVRKSRPLPLKRECAFPTDREAGTTVDIQIIGKAFIFTLKH